MGIGTAIVITAAIFGGAGLIIAMAGLLFGTKAEGIWARIEFKKVVKKGSWHSKKACRLYRAKSDNLKKKIVFFVDCS
jgi:hypothetical protein